MTLASGTRLGLYEILSPLGAGGMGEVYRARDTRLGRDVAVKVLPKDFASDRDRLARFEREARALASLNHPHVVSVYAVEESDGTPFIAMELVEGQSLADVIPNSGLPLDRFFELAVPLADAIAAAHSRGVVHRDLKSANIMVNREGRPKILDFGLAKLTETANEAGEASTMTATGAILGTLPYMAPEQVRGESADARSDVFALGVVFYEMLTGQRPFRASSSPELVSAILRDSPQDLSKLRPDAPPLLGRMVRRCLEKDPERRIQTSKDVRNELEDLRRGEDPANRELGPMEASPKPVEREFILTADTVRRLSDRQPRLVSRAMSYLDNGAESSTLVVLVHGAGGDQRQFERALGLIPERAVAPTLVGFEPSARSRPVIGVDDHSELLRAFLYDLQERLRPRAVILVGYSSGSDQCLRLASSEGGTGIAVSGLVALGPNVDLATCFFTQRLANLKAEDPSEVLAVLKSLGSDVKSLPTWLAMQEYIVGAFSKFGTDLAALTRYAHDIVAPFEAGGDPLAEWCRNASTNVPRIRRVFGEMESSSAEGLLKRHLEHNVLGARFTEASYVIEPLDHLSLMNPEVVARHVREIAKAMERP